MATTPNLFPLVDGTPGSASQVQGLFDALITQGQTAINTLVVLRENTLLLFNNALSALNGKYVRANRLPAIGVAAKFVTSDLQDINQPITTATVRCDSNNISLRERQAPGTAIVNQVRFSVDEGTIQALQVPQTGSSGNLGALYRVATSGATPVGTFDIQLLAPINTALIIFDMIDMPGTPNVVPYISQNGINFTPALTVTQNGYRLAAWFAPAEIQYIRLVITPGLPDILGGDVFTFGLTDFHAFSVQYHLRSDAYTNQIEIAPQSDQLQFITPTVSGLTYFLTFNTSPAIEIFPNDIIDVPGASNTTVTVGLLDPSGKINYVLPGDVYLSTLVVVDVTNNNAPFDMRTAPGLSPATTGLTNQYITVDGSGNMYLVVYSHTRDINRQFQISFTSGPASVNVSLQVELTTGDKNTTPIYSGAELIEV